MFYIDMHDPAVEVRPIKQASGASGFNEVFFTDLQASRIRSASARWAMAGAWR